MKYVMDKEILMDRNVVGMNRMKKRFRFLDDIWGIWDGGAKDFMEFLDNVN